MHKGVGPGASAIKKRGSTMTKCAQLLRVQSPAPAWAVQYRFQGIKPAGEACSTRSLPASARPTICNQRTAAESNQTCTCLLTRVEPWSNLDRISFKTLSHFIQTSVMFRSNLGHDSFKPRSHLGRSVTVQNLQAGSSSVNSVNGLCSVKRHTPSCSTALMRHWWHPQRSPRRMCNRPSCRLWQTGAPAAPAGLLLLTTGS